MKRKVPFLIQKTKRMQSPRFAEGAMIFQMSAFVISQIYRGEGSRFTQDTPVLLEVWAEYVRSKGKEIDLLLTPFQDPGSPEPSAGKLGVEVHHRFKEHRDAENSPQGPRYNFNLAYHQSAVAAIINFHDLVQVVLPMSMWWARTVEGELNSNVIARKKGDSTFRLSEVIKDAKRQETLRNDLVKGIRNADKPGGLTVSITSGKRKPEIPRGVIWLFRLVGLIEMHCQGQEPKTEEKPESLDSLSDRKVQVLTEEGAAEVVKTAFEVLGGVKSYQYLGKDGLTTAPLVYSINKNHTGKECVFMSGQTVKADAAERLFGADGGTIRWAIIDGGIDATHKAFRLRGIDVRPKKTRKMGGVADARVEPREESYLEAFEQQKDPGEKLGRWHNRTRIVATYDFTRIRELMSLGRFDDDSDTNQLPEWLKEMIDKYKDDVKFKISLGLFRNWRNSGRAIDWGQLGEILQIKHDDDYKLPTRPHGTHVAGILGSDWRVEDDCPIVGGMRGICPSIRMYDLRVISEDGGTDAFTVMAAIQFVRSLNSHNEIMAVHGVNLSLSIAHDVRSYACGRTPICDEAERLVGAGIVVVVAAGNNGHREQNPSGEASLGDTYQSMTVTDPGNAEAVITVGSTHRDKPHQYGVSYFSSRGPTGDGRQKPDIVAPGERIESTVPGDGIASMDGTSQAAPHVSGAAATLMARNNELIGQPAEIKRILCKSATDLGRYRFFQGSGLLDILRALQSV